MPIRARGAGGSARPGARGAGSLAAADLVLVRTRPYVSRTLGMTAIDVSIGGIAFWMPYYLETRPAHPPEQAELWHGARDGREKDAERAHREHVDRRRHR